MAKLFLSNLPYRGSSTKNYKKMLHNNEKCYNETDSFDIITILTNTSAVPERGGGSLKLIWFDCCGLAVSAIILVSYYTRNSIPILQNRIFVYQVWVAFITTSCNLILGIWQNTAFVTASQQNLVLAESVAFSYHMLRMVNALLYVYYIIIVIDISENRRFVRLCVYLPFAMAMATCILGIFWKPVFYFDQEGNHQAGSLMTILYLIAIFYFTVIIYLTIYYKNVIPFPRRMAFYSFGILVLGTVLVERRFPTIMVEGFGSVLCQLLIYLTIQRPEEIVDGSTGLLNKLSFLRMFSVQLRQHHRFDILVITIQNKRFLEKTLGVQAWNQLSREVANYLRRLTRKVKAYYLSNGLYCLIIPTEPSGGLLTEQLMETLKARSDLPWKTTDLSIPLPADFVLYRCPEDASTIEEMTELLEDVSLPYQGAAQTYAGQESGTRTKEIERALSDALKKGSFEIVYQPIYSARHDRFLSAEALLRLKDDELGNISPAEFIPIAEQSGSIIEIGSFVLNKTCQFIQDNQLSKMGIEYIEVNLSIVECLQNDLVERILETLDRYDVQADQINFEITETASDTLPESILNNIKRLSAHGIRFSLDDYGSGYSNIGRILTTPLDIIKLDRSIIQAYFSDKSQKADIILKETIQMLKKLNKSIVAEGVETEEEATRLISMGCDFIQGYYYSKPLSASLFLEFLGSRQVR